MELLHETMELLHRTKCKLNLHTWIDRPFTLFGKYPDGSYDYYYRSCSYCNKYQCRNRGEKKWETINKPYETVTQTVHKEAARLAEKAVTLSDELAKFDSHKNQKTKVFMNLLYIARELSADYLRLKTDIRMLHVSKQQSDIESERIKKLEEKGIVVGGSI